MKPRHRQSGMALVAALFLIVVVAALGAFAVRIGAGQQQTVNLALLGSRALAAASGGIELAAARVSVSPAPPSGSETFTITGGALAGFTVNVQWAQTTHVDEGQPLSMYEVSSVAQAGTYGTAEFVSRRVRARVTNRE